MKKLNLLSFILVAIACNAFAQTVCDTCIHADGVPEMTIYEVVDAEVIDVDGVREASYVGEGIELEAVCLIDDGDGAPDASLASGVAAKMWMTYDDEAFYGFVEIETSIDMEVDQAVCLTYDFEDPAYYTFYNWGGGIVDGDPAVFTNVVLVDALDEVTTGIRGTSFFFKKVATGYTYEWKTLIASEVTSDTDVIDAMLARKTFTFDTFFEIKEYDTDGVTSLARASLGWADPTNSTWKESTFSGIVTLGGAYVSTGISVSNSASSMSIYPNPVLKTLFIDNVTGSVNVLNVAGKQVIKRTAFNGNLDVSELVEGVYFISITEADGTINTSRFIKK